jgi:hypothetical protein
MAESSPTDLSFRLRDCLLLPSMASGKVGDFLPILFSNSNLQIKGPLITKTKEVGQSQGQASQKQAFHQVCFFRSWSLFSYFISAAIEDLLLDSMSSIPAGQRLHTAGGASEEIRDENVRKEKATHPRTKEGIRNRFKHLHRSSRKGWKCLFNQRNRSRKPQFDFIPRERKGTTHPVREKR